MGRSHTKAVTSNFVLISFADTISKYEGDVVFTPANEKFDPNCAKKIDRTNEGPSRLLEGTNL